MEQQRIVIVGAGAAGLSAATTVRAEGYEGPLTIVNGEVHRPYNRMLVNKGVLSGLLTAEQITQPGASALEADTVQGKAASLDPDSAILTLEDGRQLRYDALIAASGSAPQPSAVAAASSDRVFHLHTVDDATRLHTQLAKGRHGLTITILGAGFIGSEVASSLAESGAQVHLVSRSSTPLASALGDHIAGRLTELHDNHVKTHFGQSPTNISTGSRSVTVTLSDGMVLESDVVLVAHGTKPSTAWLTGNDGGLAVDARLQSRDYERVYAAGSIALHTTRTGQLYRIDHWDAAVAQGAHAARAVLHDLQGAPDPDAYILDSGFTITLYQHSAAAYGAMMPGVSERHHDTGSSEAILTSFHTTDSSMIAVAGLDAFPQLFTARAQLRTP